MIELRVENMHCGGCVRSVTNVVQTIDPLATVDVNLASKTVRIETHAELASMTSALAEAGFPACLNTVA